MQKIKLIIYFICIFLITTSCANQANTSENKNPPASNDLSNQQIIHSSDSANNRSDSIAQPPKKSGYKSVFPKGMYKTYPQIVRSVFGVGSTKEEVLNIMGKPELIEHPKDGYETWFYGKVEITFRYTIVDKVYREDLCPPNKYAFYEDLLTSDDPVERRFGAKLLEGSVKQYQYR